MTPAALFRPAGPRFRLVFGETAPGDPGIAPSAGSVFIPTPAFAAGLFGWGIIYALHARACIERRRVWQAEHYVGAVRDHALSLACLRQGLIAVQARGYDDLPAQILARFEAPTSPRSSPQRSGQHLPRPFWRSRARARRQISPMRRSSPSASPSFATVSAINRGG
jgi:hypothetical protein